MLKQKLSFETDTQEPLLEEWYWHTLYFMRRSQAKLAQQQILATFDGYCELAPHFDQYSVTFSTNYLFEAEHQQQLAQMIDFKPIETSFNETGEGEEDLLNIFRRTEEVSLKRTRIAYGLCTLCGCRTTYGLWCAKCKRTYLKSAVEFGEPDEPDPCPFCNAPLAQGRSRRATLENDLQYLIHIICATLLGVIALPVILIGLLAGLVLWLFEEH